ncbi:uncharacterized protein LOC144864279 [Branchiostoma floridae x Branchiostoma japonicum]|uniref:Uncharacterized protein n=1 Tax=Branchiostoma floridae TaxID=7739 RepID=C3YA19_BRAFL|eukprot:XP_002606918.1 hypothetical protein BRAFLDRAFT_91687 [Branchiostoma floridae]
MAEKQDPDLTGYIHNVSPMKKSRRGASYFNFDLQEKDAVRKAVCFSPEKRKVVEDQEQSQHGCKITRYSQGSFSQTDIVINKATIIDKEQLPFPSKKVEVPFTPLKDIDHLTPGQVINIKVKVISTKPAKTVPVKDTQGTTKELQKTEVLCADHTATRNLVVWEPITLQENHSYKLDVRVRLFGSSNYINTMRDTTVEEINDIETITSTDDETRTISSPGSFKGKISAMTIISRFIKCVDCRKKIPHTDKRIVTCPACQMTMLAKNCPADITAKLSVSLNEDAAVGRNMTITCFKDTLAYLTGTDPVLLSDDDILEQVLVNEETYSFDQNPQNICTNISLTDITDTDSPESLFN